MNIVINFLSRATTSIGVILLPFVLGHLLGLKQTGEFLIFYSAITTISVICRLGLDTSTLKFGGKEGEYVNKEKKLVFISGIVGASLMSGIMAILIYFCLVIFFNPKYFHAGIILIGVIFFYSSNTLIGANLKSINKSYLSPIFDSGGAELFLIMILLSSSLFMGREFVVSEVLFLLGGASMMIYLVGIVGLFLYYRRFEVTFKEVFSKTRDMIFQAKTFFCISIITHITDRGMPMVIGAFFAPTFVALFGIIRAMASMVSFILMIYNAILPPKFAFYFNRGEISNIKMMYQKAVFTMSIISLLVIAFLFFFIEEILNIASVEMNQSIYFYVMMFSIAQFVNVITGPAGFLLNMTGFERFVLNTTLITGALSLLLVAFAGYIEEEILVFIGLAIIVVLRKLFLFGKTYSIFWKNKVSLL